MLFSFKMFKLKHVIVNVALDHHAQKLLNTVSDGRIDTKYR